jgi:hypothetical protein
MRHGPPSPEFAPLAAALAATHTPLLMASRSTRDAALLAGDGSAAPTPHLRVLSGFPVCNLQYV